MYVDDEVCVDDEVYADDELCVDAHLIHARTYTRSTYVHNDRSLSGGLSMSLHIHVHTYTDMNTHA